MIIQTVIYDLFLNKLINNMDKAPLKIKKGYVRVLVTARNKTTRIRERLANNPDYMTKNGLTRISEPVDPTVTPIQVPQQPKVTPAKPVKANG